MKLINKYTKVVFFLLILFFSFSPNISKAQIDPRCFTLEECVNRREQTMEEAEREKLEDGFYTKGDAKTVCGNKIYSSITGKKEDAGFCLPGGKAETEISFGGKTEFTNFPQFIKYIYKWSMIAASVLAVLMIIIAGIEYMMSMGNSSRVTSAKNKAVGAISGIILLAGSYALLNTINPALVNLRLPSVWLIKGQQLSANYCPDLNNSKKRKVGEAKKNGEKVKISEASFDTTAEQAKCGREYYISQQTKQLCKGLYCGNDREICLENKNECKRGVIGGVITGSNFTTEEGDYNVHNLRLYEVCENGKISYIGSNEPTALSENKEQTYTFTNFSTSCSESETLGYYLGAQINDPKDSLWKQIGRGIDITGGLLAGKEPKGDEIDDWWALGKRPDSHDCSVNLGAQLASNNNSLECYHPAKSAIACSCAAVSGSLNSLSNERNVLEKYLISKKDLKNGFTCNIPLERKQFVPIVNGQSLTSWGGVIGGAVGGGLCAVAVSGTGFLAAGLCVGAGTAGSALGDYVQYFVESDPTSCISDSWWSVDNTIPPPN